MNLSMSLFHGPIQSADPTFQKFTFADFCTQTQSPFSQGWLKYKQVQMKILCIKYFQHINEIISIMQPNLTQKENNKKSEVKIENKEEMCNEQLLEEELSTLKQNIQNLLKYCQDLQNYIKWSKKSLPSTGEILQHNNYEIGSAEVLEEKCFDFPVQLSVLKQKNMGSLMQRQNVELRKTRQLYLESLNKIHKLRTQVSDLKQKLNQFAQVYQTPNLKGATSSNSKDLLARQLSLISNISHPNPPSLQCDQIDIQTLLCHQDLDMDSPLLKQNSSLKSNRKQPMIQSLITKGIDYRDKRSLKSDEFRELSTIVERYRDEALRDFNPIQMRKYKSTCYR